MQQSKPGGEAARRPTASVRWADLPTYETRDGDCVSVVCAARTLALLPRRARTRHGVFPLAITGTDVSITSALPQHVYFLREGVGFVIQTSVDTATPLPLGPDTGAKRPEFLHRTLHQRPSSRRPDRGRSTRLHGRLGAIHSSAKKPTQGATSDAKRAVVAAPESTILYFLPRADIERLATDADHAHAASLGASDGRTPSYCDINSI